MMSMGKNNKKYTIEEVREIVESKGFELLSDEYVNNKTKLAFEDGEGYIYSCNLYSFIKNKSFHKYHINNKYTIDNIRLYLSLHHPNLKLLSEKYSGIFDCLKLIDEDGYLYSLSTDVLSRGSRPLVFSSQNPYTVHNIKNWTKLNNKPFELLSLNYINNSTPLEWRCKKSNCNETFYAPWNRISSGGKCLYCIGINVKKSNSFGGLYPDLLDEWDYNKNKINPYETSKGSHEKVWWVCNTCNHEWEAYIYNRSAGRGCPCCNNSKGEQKIKNFLMNKNIAYEQEYSFYGLNSKLNNPLRFDFAIFKDNEKSKIDFLVEFDGIFHFEYKKGWIPESKLKKTQYHDKLKNTFCEKNNIKLIRIPYWDFDNIEEILVRELDLKEVK
jgi:hypothetical protein